MHESIYEYEKCKQYEGFKMSNYKPTFTITDTMTMHVNSISEKIDKMDYRNNFETKPHLRKKNKIRSIHASLQMEGNSLSINQVRDIINGRSILANAKEIQAVKNACDAYDKISLVDPYSNDDLNSTHSIMMKYLIDDPGKYRSEREDLLIGENSTSIIPSAKSIPFLMQNVFDWMNDEKENIHPLILAASFHYALLYISPYSDGNGRMARLWHLAILAKWNPIFEFMPLASRLQKHQERYYSIISECQDNGIYNSFIEFILEQIDDLLNEVLNQVKANTEDYSANVKKLLDVMLVDTTYSANGLMLLLNLKSKEILRKTYITPALNMNVIERTIPETPNSKNQKYIRRR